MDGPTRASVYRDLRMRNLNDDISHVCMIMAFVARYSYISQSILEGIRLQDFLRGDSSSVRFLFRRNEISKRRERAENARGANNYTIAAHLIRAI